MKTTEKNSQNQPVEYATDFNIYDYIPFTLVKTQLWMHQILRPESSLSVKSLANISKTESRVIMLIAHYNTITPSKLANELGLDPAVLARTLASLSKKSLITSQPSISDSRSKSMHLTQNGAALCDELIIKLKKFDAHLENILEESEKKLLRELLDKLLAGSKSFND